MTIFLIFFVIGFVGTGIADTVGHRLKMNYVRRQCDLPTKPVLRVHR